MPTGTEIHPGDIRGLNGPAQLLLHRCSAVDRRFPDGNSGQTLHLPPGFFGPVKMAQIHEQPSPSLSSPGDKSLQWLRWICRSIGVIRLRSRRRIVWIWAGGLGLLLGIHFLLTILYLAPDNLLKRRFSEPLQRYMDPLFAQNWQLFAPNPISQHRSLVIKAKYRDPRTGEIRESPWMDITRPHVRDIWENRFFNDARTLRFQTSAIKMYQSEEPDRKAAGLRMLHRLALHSLKSEPELRNVEQVKVRIVLNRFPRYPEREKPDQTGTLYFDETDWMTVRETNRGVSGGHKP